jgi:hypothetical protein
MNKIEREFFHLREAMLEYKRHGIDHKDFVKSMNYITQAENAYHDFKKKTGILGLYKGG